MAWCRAWKVRGEQNIIRRQWHQEEKALLLQRKQLHDWTPTQVLQRTKSEKRIRPVTIRGWTSRPHSVMNLGRKKKKLQSSSEDFPWEMGEEKVSDWAGHRHFGSPVMLLSAPRGLGQQQPPEQQPEPPEFWPVPLPQQSEFRWWRRKDRSSWRHHLQDFESLNLVGLPLPCFASPTSLPVSSGSTSLIITCTHIFVSGSADGEPDLSHLRGREYPQIYLLKLMLRLAVMTDSPVITAVTPPVTSIMVARAPPWSNLVITGGKEKCFQEFWKQRASQEREKLSKHLHIIYL